MKKNSRKNKYFICTVEGSNSSIWQCTQDTPKTIKMASLEETLIFEKDVGIVQKKDNKCRHTWRDFGDTFVIYPYMEGVPYHFEFLTRQYLENEVLNCEIWGVSSKFYLELLTH